MQHNAKLEKWSRIESIRGVKLKTLYYISNFGRAKNSKGKILKPTNHNHGYNVYAFYVSKDFKNRFIKEYAHRLVATHFIRKPENCEVVNHKDFNKKNNHYKNLEWCTQLENIKHTVKNKKHRNGVTLGEKHFNSKFTSDDIIFMRELARTISEVEISCIFNCAYQTVMGIVKRQAWKHVL